MLSNQSELDSQLSRILTRGTFMITCQLGPLMMMCNRLSDSKTLNETEVFHLTSSDLVISLFDEQIAKICMFLKSIDSDISLFLISVFGDKKKKHISFLCFTNKTTILTS